MSFTGESRHCVHPVHESSGQRGVSRMGRVGRDFQAQWQAELARRREAETSLVAHVLQRKRSAAQKSRFDAAVKLKRELKDSHNSKSLLGIDPIEFVPPDQREELMKTLRLTQQWRCLLPWRLLK